MRFSTILVASLASIGAVDASCFCSPRNGCKCACGHSRLRPDSQWSWHGDGQDGFLGREHCGSGQGRKVASNRNLGGDRFPWKCLYIRC
ncbi:hypothetical protein CP533_4953 [Ophiocordyceps camponoti-saundersi (nom. inval.)]|nr:hypothetical protein CP533_4953 [Ophiocordyceps camponoti-saundersi (nom. inval.)]